MYAVGFLALSWLLIGLTLLGLGTGLLRLLRVPVQTPAAALAAMPVGYGVAVAVLQVWHLWLPVTWAAFGLLVVAAVIAAVCSHADLRKLPHAFRWTDVGLGLAALAAVVWLAVRARGPGVCADSGGYHWNVIAWSNAYPIIPGLANIHHRLGFNNAGLLFDAMLNTGLWRGQAGHLSNAFLVLVLWAHVLYGVRALLRGRPTPTAMFAAALALPAVAMTVAIDLPAPETDTPAGVMTLLGALYLTGLLLEDDARDLHLAASVICLATAVCLKLSASWYFLACLSVWAWAVGFRPALGPSERRVGRGRLAALGACVVLLLGTWLLRGAILTGYVLFPSGSLRLPVDWALPPAKAQAIRQEITTFARYHVVKPAATWNQWDWVPAFFRTLPWATTLYCLESAVPLLLLGWVLLPRGRKWTAGRAVLLCLPPAAGLAAWFLLAPDLRFGWHLFWVAPASALAFLAVKPRDGKWVLSPFLCAVVLACWAAPVVAGAAGRYAGWWDMAWPRPGPDRGFFPVDQPAGVRWLALQPGGPSIAIATDGMIWDYPAPSTSILEGPVAMRDPHDLRRGFNPAVARQGPSAQGATKPGGTRTFHAD